MTEAARAGRVRSAAPALWWNAGLPALAGAAAVFGFAPFYAWPVPVACLAVLVLVWSRCRSPRGAALTGFAGS